MLTKAVVVAIPAAVAFIPHRCDAREGAAAHRSNLVCCRPLVAGDRRLGERLLALTQRAGGEYLAQQKQEAVIEFALHRSKRAIQFLTSAEGLNAHAAARAMWGAGWLLLACFLFCASFVCFVVGSARERF